MFIKNHTRKGKFSLKWLGPYEVVSLQENENVLIKRGRREVRFHKNELKMYHSLSRTKSKSYVRIDLYFIQDIYI